MVSKIQEAIFIKKKEERILVNIFEEEIPS